MSPWRSDPEAAAAELVGRSLASLPLAGRVLLVDPPRSLSRTLAGSSASFTRWSRRCRNGLPASPWPTAGPFDAALVRLAKAREEQEMAAHAVLSVLAPQANFILFGGNDEGIRSAAATLAKLCGPIQTLAARGHGRILAAVRPAEVQLLRASLAAWRTVLPLEVAGTVRQWVTYPGVFAAQRIDAGSALLVEALPALAPGCRVLDYGCGSGAIAAGVHCAQAAAVVAMLDNDTIALEAARENVPGARPMLADGIAGGPFDLIVSNPPLHAGVAEQHGFLHGLIARAPAFLAPAGCLQIVVQRRVALDRLFAQHFAATSVVAENGRYRVWRASRA
jgi:16S rRNA (guanine1207-N2)-methyltransferase